MRQVRAGNKGEVKMPWQFYYGGIWYDCFNSDGASIEQIREHLSQPLIFEFPHKWIPDEPKKCDKCGHVLEENKVK